MDLVASNLLLILCFAVGTGLMIVEAFLPGFGIAGVSGLILEIAGIILAYRRFGTVPALIALAAVLLVVGLVVFFSYRSAMNGRISKSPLVLKDTEVPVAAAENPWKDREGVAVSPLRPAGFVEIDGQRLNASTSGDFLERGAAVKVTGTEGDHLLVRALENG